MDYFLFLAPPTSPEGQPGSELRSGELCGRLTPPTSCVMGHRYLNLSEPKLLGFLAMAMTSHCYTNKKTHPNVNHPRKERLDFYNQ